MTPPSEPESGTQAAPPYPSEPQPQASGTQPSSGQTLSAEGVVRVVSEKEVVIEQDTGEILRLRIEKTAMTLPAPGERVRVQYQDDGTQQSATSIEKSEQMP